MDEVYRNVEEFKSYLDTMKEIREGDDENKKSAFQIFNFPKGKKLQLTVEVRDPDLVNAVLTSEWGDEGLMPGMSVTSVNFGDLEGKEIIAGWLREKLTELE